MQLLAKFRSAFFIAATVLLMTSMAVGAVQNGGMRRGGVGGRPEVAGAQSGGQRQGHLGQWLASHSNLPLADQQRALEKEPGFRELPPQTQQRILDRLTQLNKMSPEQRRRLLDHTEALEQLTIPQRQQVQGALQQFRALEPNRRRMVARAFGGLREMPLDQRQTVLGSERFRSQFSDQERKVLSNLLAVEAYIPFEHPVAGPTAGK